MAPSTGNFTFDLEVGESTHLNLFDIWTNESAVNPDDRVARDLDVAFDFSAPVTGGSIIGQSLAEGSCFSTARSLGQPADARLRQWRPALGGALRRHLQLGLFGLRRARRRAPTSSRRSPTSRPRTRRRCRCRRRWRCSARRSAASASLADASAPPDHMGRRPPSAARLLPKAARLGDLQRNIGGPDRVSRDGTRTGQPGFPRVRRDEVQGGTCCARALNPFGPYCGADPVERRGAASQYATKAEKRRRPQLGQLLREVSAVRVNATAAPDERHRPGRRGSGR